eukprot:6214510-Pleurochrysis_carterae.AAC.3
MYVYRRARARTHAPNFTWASSRLHKSSSVRSKASKFAARKFRWPANTRGGSTTLRLHSGQAALILSQCSMQHAW